MGWVHIDNFPGGVKLERLIAMHSDVQDAMDEHATFRGHVAAGLLEMNRFQDHSQISVERVPDELGFADMDRMVVLDDTRGLKAAMTIEFGRKKTGTNAGMRGIAPLRKAFGLEVD